MEDMKKQFETIYKNNLLGKQIVKCEVNMITDQYLEYVENTTWLTEGGVELTMDDGQVLSFTYDTDSLQFIFVESDLLPFINEFDYYPIDLAESRGVYDVLEETIVDVDIEWTEIIETDYTGNAITSEPYAIGFLLHFQNGSTLQISSVVTKINADTQKFAYIRYALEGSIIVSFNNPIAIESI